LEISDLFRYMTSENDHFRQKEHFSKYARTG
jgi:hypothetical protein